MSGSINVDQAIGHFVVAGLSAISDISQSSVTTSMRCGAIFNVNVRPTTNFLLISSVIGC